MQIFFLFPSDMLFFRGKLNWSVTLCTTLVIQPHAVMPGTVSLRHIFMHSSVDLDTLRKILASQLDGVCLGDFCMPLKKKASESKENFTCLDLTLQGGTVWSLNQTSEVGLFMTRPPVNHNVSLAGLRSWRFLVQSSYPPAFLSQTTASFWVRITLRTAKSQVLLLSQKTLIQPL